MKKNTYHPHVPPRLPRPRFALPPATGFLALQRGCSEASEVPLSLPSAIREGLAQKGCLMISFYRCGPYAAEVLFGYGGGFWTLRSETPRVEGWETESLEDWLFGDLLYVQLPRKLQSILAE